MSLAKTLLTAGALFGGYYLYQKYHTAVSLSYKLASLSFGSIVIGQPLPVVIEFSLINPTNQTLTLNGITGNISVNGTFLSTINSTTAITVPANSSINYPVNFSVSVGSTLNQILNFFKAPGSTNVNFLGTVNSEGLAVPFSDSVTV